MNEDDKLRMLRDAIDAMLGVESQLTRSQMPPTPPKRRRKSKYATFSKRFQFRKKKRTESGADYIAARAKAVGRAWRREKRK